MIGYRFTDFIPTAGGSSLFEQLLNIFLQLLNITGGNVAEALDILNQLDRKYKISEENYGIGDFIQELKDKGFIKENETEPGNFR